MGPYGHNPSIDEIQSQYKRASDMISRLEKEKPSDNIMVSTLSIEIALLMIANTLGDKGKSAILKYLGLDEDSFNDYAHRQLERLREQESLRIANALWVREHSDGILELADGLQDKLKDNFRLECKTFKNSVEPINHWVRDVTKNKITSILSDADMTPDIESVIANAVHFKSDWTEQLHPLGKRQFDSLDGKKQDIDFVGTVSTRFGYAEDDKYQMVQLGYRDMSSFVAFLPKDETIGVPSFTSSNPINFSRDYKVTLEMPKFESRYELSLSRVADTMGVAEIFQQNEVSNLFKKNKYTLNDIKHKTYINVDEKGTEAAAVTAGVMRCACCVMREPKAVKVVLNRPFYYGIISRYGDMLFIGKYKN